MSDKPMVVCLCPTFNRVDSDADILGECLYWFHRQNYANKRLLILSDCPNQNLNYSHPDVMVVNLPYRCHTLGLKYNHMLTFAHDADIILPWEDDDICLPDRITQAVEMLEGFDYWNPHMSFFQNGRGSPLELCSPASIHHNASAYRYRIYSKLGLRYPTTNAEGCRQDAIFDFMLRHDNRIAVNPMGVSHDALTYIYRWGIARKFGNLSGHPNPTKAYREYVGTPGVFPISPAIGRDYEEEAAQWKDRCQLQSEQSSLQ